MVSLLLRDPATQGSIPSIPEIYSEEKIVNVAEVSQWPCLGESGQWLENVDWTNLGHDSGKIVQQKKS